MKNISANRKNEIYGNWLVLHPDGFEMFRCTAKKANWYLSRELGIIISSNPPTMQLTFEPGGAGWKDDIFSLHQKTNECVVCGLTDLEKLTRHHIIPSMYKKFFPRELKVASSHDVVCICREHHDDYEINHALKIKNELGEKYNISVNSFNSTGLPRAIKLSKAYIFNGENIPKSRLEDLWLQISISLKRDELVSHEEMEELSKLSHEDFYKENCHGKVVVEKLENLQEFTEMWRQHFIDTMHPKFMPKHWSVERLINKELIVCD